ncbi:response regulator [uncultured Amnibacterium sp.]|uniref:response regulator n=1 Tax=uncultured Amnibacterium sp. TaxID=1631851 RepID=UPI0035CA7D31
MTTSVLIVDDQPLFCSGIALLIEAQPDLEFAGAAHTGASAIERVGELHPDVVLMDLRMPGGNGLAAMEAILAKESSPRVLVLTTFRDGRIVQQAMRAGAAGFITKDATPVELLTAIRDVVAGKPVSASGAPTSMLPDPLYAGAPNPEAISALTAREHEVFLHLARGLTNNQIAVLSHISENTVRNHVSSLLQKLDLENRTQAAVFAYREGLLPAPLRRII